MKKIALLLAVCLVFGALFAGCAAGKATSGTEKTAASSAADDTTSAGGTGKKMKFAYVANMLSHEFYQRCIKGMQAACDEDGIELVMADSNSEPATQVNNLEIYASQNDVDAILCSPIDPAALVGGVKKAADKGIPTITESNAVEGAVTMVGAKWHDNGAKMGAWAGKWLLDHNMEGNVLIVGYPAFNDTVQVEAGFTEALKASGAKINYVVSIDGQAFKEKAMQVATDALTAHPDVNVIMGINDDSILGAIQAAKAQGMDPAKMLTITHGMEGNPGLKAMMEDHTLTGGYALFPEFYGQSMVKAALAAVNGEKLPELYETPMLMLDESTANKFYQKSGEDYVLNLDAVKAAIQ
jgi:ribose transport system substrate-binding protein